MVLSFRSMEAFSSLTLIKFHVEYLAKCRGSIHTRPEKFENATLFLRLGLPFTLIRHENGAFRTERSSNRRDLKTPGFRFCVDGNLLKTGLFENDGVTIIT